MKERDLFWYIRLENLVIKSLIKGKKILLSVL